MGQITLQRIQKFDSQAVEGAITKVPKMFNMGRCSWWGSRATKAVAMVSKCFVQILLPSIAQMFSLFFCRIGFSIIVQRERQTSKEKKCDRKKPI